jgi:apolipoprotein N-acyltransferase
MVRVLLLSPPWRLVLAALVVTSLASLPTYGLALFLLPPVPLPVMVRSFAIGSALPGLLAWLLARAFRGAVTLEEGLLRLRRADVAIEVEPQAIAAVEPWRVALPCAGVRLVLRSGRAVPFRLGAWNPTDLIERLRHAGIAVDAASAHPSVVCAATRRRFSWRAPLVKFPLFGALPASVLFYTHQHIAYGGTFGQYYLEGLGPYLSTFAQYWATTVILLVSYASLWRAVAELAVWVTAALARTRAAAARRIADAVCAVAYYGGVPLLLALRYMD